MITFNSNKSTSAAISKNRNAFRGKLLITGSENSLARYLANGLADSGVALSIQAVNADVILAARPRFTTVEYSLADQRFAEAVAALTPDIILHAPAEPVNDTSSHWPMAAFNRIIEKTATLCDVVRRNSPRTHVILMSTADVYGECLSPKSENDPVNPVSLQGRYSAIAEELLRDYANIHNLSASVLRVGSAYGPSVNNNPVHDLVFNLLGPQGTNSAIPLNMAAHRDLIHAGDVLQALRLILASDYRATYNIATGVSLSMEELSTHLCSILELTSPAITKSSQLLTALHQRICIDKIESLGFKPEVPLIEGLRGYAAWWTGMKAA